MSTALVSLGIGTGFERFYGVLKRLGTTPLGRPRWLAAKFLVVLTIEVGQWAVLIPTGIALGWDPGGRWPAAIAASLLATAAFGGLALLLAGTLPAMLNLAVCNGLYLALMVTGDMIVRLDQMPHGLVVIARVLPAAPLAEIMISSLSRDPGAHLSGSAWPVLAGWAVVCPLLAAWRFRWE
jgi:ABC-2 type transport system permease protein